MHISGLEVRYGPVRAINDVSANVAEGKITAIIGPNGAGKSTLMRTIAGLRAVNQHVAGDIKWGDRSILGDSAYKIARDGLMLVPEGRRLFPGLSVEENLLLGGYRRRNDKEAVRAAMDEVMEMFPVLGVRRNQAAGTLSGGEQQMVAVGRAIVSGAGTWLLDEPSLGLAPIITQQLFEVIGRVAKAGRTILLVEQYAESAIELADQVLVLVSGQLVWSGSGEEARSDGRVAELAWG
ncbi:MAG: ABC transporter ATP-binding protein [Acidimicrobiia bacterium]|nr:ABC transporter ATP-binding protein [Acidimicrobiia bacterium]MBP8181311.1 ABC transporter ATP-binding protein [Acidimicrobiia bacterium]